LDPSITYMAKVKNNDEDEGSETRRVYGEVLAECHDFQNELTSLQHLAQTLGSTVNRLTKSHPELAGKGIEYSWGCAKCYYQSAKLKEKKGKDNFMNLVKTSLLTITNHGGGLDIHLIRKFSK